LNQFDEQISEVFPIWDEVKENCLIQKNSLENWIAWADNNIALFSEMPPGWLCDISLAKSLEDVQIALNEGFLQWSRAVTQDLKCEYWTTRSRLYIGLVYLQWKQGKISLATCIYYAWCYAHVGYPCPVSERNLERLLGELQSHNLHNKPIEAG
jgi:hypothetical protein